MNYLVNLLPLELQNGSKMNPKILMLISIIVLTAGGFATACIFFGVDFINTRNELTTLRQQVPKIAETASQLEELKRQRRELDTEAGVLERLVRGKHAWSKMFLDLNKVIPGEILLSSLKLQAAGAAQGTAQETTGKTGAVPSLLHNSLQKAGQLTGEAIPQSSGMPAAIQTTQNPARQTQEQEQHGQADEQDRDRNHNLDHPAPDTLIIEGESTSLAAVGVLVYHLGRLPHFSQVNLKEIKFDDAKGITNFSILAQLKGGSDG